jgi:hypothetical protein
MHLTAAQGGSADILVCLQQRGFADAADLKAKLLNVAGGYNKLAAAQWLRQQDAEAFWRGDTLACARAEGSQIASTIVQLIVSDHYCS